VTAFNRVTVVVPVAYLDARQPGGALLRVW
jgi:hypothetical protein